MTQLRNISRGNLHKDQYQRVLRWYERFRNINDGRQVGAQFECQYDEMLAFFMNCYHLKDWIKRDFELEKNHHDYIEFNQVRDEIERFISDNECLALCADLCNGAKHCSVDEKRHRFIEPTLVRSVVYVDEKEPDKYVKRGWMLISESGKEYDAFDLATQCVKKWKEFLDNHKKQIEKITLSVEEGETGEECETGDIDKSTISEGQTVGAERAVWYRVFRKRKK